MCAEAANYLKHQVCAWSCVLTLLSSVEEDDAGNGKSQ